MKDTLETIIPGWTAEHPFAESIGRKWRFDFAHLGERIAVEKNGNAYFTKGGGRHGKPADLQKINCAQAMGWMVLQYGTSKKELARMRHELLDILGARKSGIPMFKEVWQKNLV